MWVTEREFALTIEGPEWDLLTQIKAGLSACIREDEKLLRFVITSYSPPHAYGEMLIVHNSSACGYPIQREPIALRQREFENTGSFNTVFVVPTGIGAEIGGHAGDAGAAVKLFASISDSVITHPNTVNASDINELPENSLYVEGSILSKLLLGSIALQPVRKNRILVVLDNHEDVYFTNAAINSVNAARSSYGLDVSRIISLDPGVRLSVTYSRSGRASGEVSNLEQLCAFLTESRREYDAVALSSVIDVPSGYHQQYFDSAGQMVNPWGGVEAMLTHTLSCLFGVPSAHSPMLEVREIANSDPGIVDPRLAAEAVSFTFLQCVLKGLQRSPRIVEGVPLGTHGLIDATNISCLVVPDGCLGIPTLAALTQGIPVISVRENANLMKNDLSLLPWRAGQFYRAQNYWEAAGILAALRAGIAPESVRRPIDIIRGTIHRTAVTLKRHEASPKPSISLAENV